MDEELPGSEILVIESAEDFETALRERDFDLVITDYQLVWTNGVDVLKRLKHDRPMVPVIMFTASGGEEIAVDAMKHGLDDYIIKSTGQLMRLRGSIRAAADRIARNGYVKELVVKMKRYDGESIWVEINGKQVYKDGVLLCNEGSVQDVTERILYQMEMKTHVAM